MSSRPPPPRNNRGVTLSLTSFISIAALREPAANQPPKPPVLTRHDRLLCAVPLTIVQRERSRLDTEDATMCGTNRSTTAERSFATAAWDRHTLWISSISDSSRNCLPKERRATFPYLILLPPGWAIRMGPHSAAWFGLLDMKAPYRALGFLLENQGCHDNAARDS